MYTNIHERTALSYQFILIHRQFENVNVMIPGQSKVMNIPAYFQIYILSNIFK